MSKILIDRDVVEQALEAFEHHANQCPYTVKGYTLDAAEALRTSLEQPQVDQEPVRWPANASEVRAFLSGHVAAERYARDDHQPDDSDTYTLSAHDLLGAIYWWTDFDPQPPRQPLTDVQVHAIWDSKYRGWFSRDQMEHITRAIEVAHGIGGEV